MPVYGHLGGLSGSIDDLEACANNPPACDPNLIPTMAEDAGGGFSLTDSVAVANAMRIMNALAKGMAAGNPIIGTNPFYGSPSAMMLFWAMSPANPDVAITLVVQAVEDFLQDAPTVFGNNEDNNDKGFLARAILLLGQNIPKAQADSQARGILELKSLAGLTSLPNTAARAVAALQALPRPQPTPGTAPIPGTVPTPGTVPPGVAAAPTLSQGAKNALMILGGVTVVGGAAILAWRMSRPQRVPRAVPRWRTA